MVKPKWPWSMKMIVPWELILFWISRLNILRRLGTLPILRRYKKRAQSRSLVCCCSTRIRILRLNPMTKLAFSESNGQICDWWPQGDSGLTGRKIIVDTYGWLFPSWWRCVFRKESHKSRPQRGPCRYVAKNIVAAGLADRIEVQLSYAIGWLDPWAFDWNLWNF